MNYAYSLILMVVVLGGCHSSSNTTSDTESESETSSYFLNDTDTATSKSLQDTSSEILGSTCDGFDVDCYEDCWSCAVQNQCKEEFALCHADDGCHAYLTCKDTVCCDPQNPADCKTGEAWDNCMAQCKATYNVSMKANDLLMDIDKCIVCNACHYSCATVDDLFNSMCVDKQIYQSFCYQENLEPGQLACFTWATTNGGPCAKLWDTCNGNSDCTKMYSCYLDSWNYPDADARQAKCEIDFSGGSVDYWAAIQCVYCDACDIACATDAGSKRCSEYQAKE